MKDIKTADELNELVHEAVRNIEHVADGASVDPVAMVHVGQVQLHQRDDQGRNWDISAGRNLGPFSGAVAKAVEPLRDRYDLAEPKQRHPSA